MMFGWTRRPTEARVGAVRGLDVRDRGGIGPLPQSVLGVHHVELRAQLAAEPVHERGTAVASR
jgi:hypothetical protein